MAETVQDSAPAGVGGRASAPVPIPASSWWVFTAVGIGMFMAAVDGSVVNVALGGIRESLHASVAGIQWVVIIYLLVVSGTLLAFGRLGDLRGHRNTYILGFAFFIAGSILCALARTELALVAFRAFQAFGAAMLFANSPAIITDNVPPQRRGEILGLQATLTYLGLTVGPPLGGLLADRFGWPAIFSMNVPIGAVAIYLSWRFIPRDAGSGRAAGERFDLPGAAAFTIGLVTLLFALNQGHDLGWGSPTIVGLLVLAVLLLVGFVVIEKRSASPMLDLSLFDDRAFAFGSATAVINYIGGYPVVLLMPFYLIQGRGMSATTAGLLLGVQTLVMAVAAPIAGRLSDRVGGRRLIVGGMLALAAGVGCLGLLGASTPLPLVAGALFLVGLGTGTFISPNTSAVLGAAPPHRRGIASGVLAEARNVGMVLGVGLAGAVFTTTLGGVLPGPHPVLFRALSSAFLVSAAVSLAGAGVAFLGGRSRRTADQT